MALALIGLAGCTTVAPSSECEAAQKLARAVWEVLARAIQKPELDTTEQTVLLHTATVAGAAAAVADLPDQAARARCYDYILQSQGLVQYPPYDTLPSASQPAPG